MTREAAALGLLDLSAQRQHKSEQGSRFFLGPREDRCACALAADADEVSNTYTFNAEWLDAMDAVLRHLARQAGAAGFTLRAAFVTGSWSDLPSPDVQPIELEQLIRLVRAGGLRRNRRYEVVVGQT